MLRITSSLSTMSYNLRIMLSHVCQCSYVRHCSTYYHMLSSYYRILTHIIQMAGFTVNQCCQLGDVFAFRLLDCGHFLNSNINVLFNARLKTSNISFSNICNQAICIPERNNSRKNGLNLSDGI